MAIDLTKPLKWTDPDAEQLRMLSALQGNILKGHGRDCTWNVFFRFGADHAAGARLVRELGNYHVTDALTQLREASVFKETGKMGGTFVAMGLSAKGYDALGIARTGVLAQEPFASGMKSNSSLANLNDPVLGDWEAEFAQEIHGIIVVGDHDALRGEDRRWVIADLIAQAGGSVVKTQQGKALHNDAGAGIEHFGYVDGRSQPLLLAEDIKKEANEGGGIAHWDPTAGLNAALVLDPLVPPPPAPTPAEDIGFGSFFIFRKLEQNVRTFKRAELELALKLGLSGDDMEVAGAMCVGRFEDGTPVTMSNKERNLEPPNDFDYAGDAGSRCPFHSHIRKTNPRGGGGFGQPEATEKAHLMPRRGIPYEDVQRPTHPNGLPGAETLAEFDANVAPLAPTGGVGLLFMAYNSDLNNQFVFTQQSWANSQGFPQAPKPPGIDPVIGQGANIADGPEWPKQWDNPAAGVERFDFAGHVKMKGGEYFFTPSLLWLRTVGASGTNAPSAPAAGRKAKATAR